MFQDQVKRTESYHTIAQAGIWKITGNPEGTGNDLNMQACLSGLAAQDSHRITEALKICGIEALIRKKLDHSEDIILQGRTGINFINAVYGKILSQTVTWHDGFAANGEKRSDKRASALTAVLELHETIAVLNALKFWGISYTVMDGSEYGSATKIQIVNDHKQDNVADLPFDDNNSYYKLLRLQNFYKRADAGIASLANLVHFFNNPRSFDKQDDLLATQQPQESPRLAAMVAANKAAQEKDPQDDIPTERQDYNKAVERARKNPTFYI